MKVVVVVFVVIVPVVEDAEPPLSVSVDTWRARARAHY
jgi:hypothetical protein